MKITGINSSLVFVNSLVKSSFWSWNFISWENFDTWFNLLAHCYFVQIAYSWVSLNKLHASRNLFISSMLSNLMMYNCPHYTVWLTDAKSFCLSMALCFFSFFSSYDCLTKGLRLRRAMLTEQSKNPQSDMITLLWLGRQRRWAWDRFGFEKQ